MLAAGAVACEPPTVEQRGDASGQRVWAALTERGLSNVAMKPGVNIRRFTDVDMHGQGEITYDKATGYLTLAPGAYRVDGWSLTTFGWMLTPQQLAARYSAPGYAFIWNVDDSKMEILASLQDPLDSTPSVLNGVLKVEKTTSYYLAHQNGDKVEGISLELYDARARMPDGQISTNHAFAQLVVEKL